MDDIKDGWAFDQYSGAIYFFEHYPLLKAKEMANRRDYCYIIETINYTVAEKPYLVHHNKYFALDFPSAIAMAAKMEIEWQDVAENVSFTFGQ